LKNKKIKGFTILELAVALGVLAIIVTAVWFGSSQSYRRDIISAANLLAADIRYAQQMAIQKGVDVQISIFEDGYLIDYRPDGGANRPLLEGFRAFPNASNAGSSVQTINFTPRGTTNTPMTITLENRHYNISLTLTLGAGRVLVRDPLPL